jgi:hypothetical protein
MTRRTGPSAHAVRLLTVGLIAAAATIPAGTVSAAEVCVECAEPAATYRCVVADEELATLRGAAKALQVVCMTELSKAGGHRFCRVRQGTFGGVCAGDERRISLAGRDGTVDVEVTSEPQGDRKGPPQTLADMAKEGVKSSGDTLKNAGSAIKDGAEQIGSTVGTAVDCVVSLFKRC